MIDILCISTFDYIPQWGKINNITVNKVYKTKLISGDKALIINDINKPQFVGIINFVIYKNILKIT